MSFPTNTRVVGAEGMVIIMFPGAFDCVTIFSSTPEWYTNITWGLKPPAFPVSATVESDPACGSTTMTATGGVSYQWSGGQNPNSATNTITQSGTYLVTITNAEGCTAVTSASATINPLPTVNITSSGNPMCIGGTRTLTATPAGGTFTVTSGPGTVNGNILTAIDDGSIQVTYTYTDANNCTNSKNQTITVLSAPTVDSVANQTFCVGQSAPSTTFSGPEPGTVFNWTRTAGSIGLTPTSGSGNVPAFTTANSGGSPLTSTFTVTPTISSGGTTCAGTPRTFTVTVNPRPTVTAVTNKTYCIGQTVPKITFTGSAPGAVYQWTRTSGAIGLDSLSGVDSIPSFTATNTDTIPLTSTFTVTPTFTNNGVACTGPSITFTITVNPSLSMDTVSNRTYCVGQTTPEVVFTGPVPGMSYSWNRTVAAIGLFSNSGTGNVPAFATTNNTSNPLTSTFAVTPFFTNNGVTCSGNPDTFTITVNPIPTVTTVPNQTVCANQNVSSVTFTGQTPGSTFSWTRTNAGIGLATTSGTGDVPSFTATNPGVVPITSTFTVTPSFTNNGVTCTGTPKTFSISVNPIPNVNQVQDRTVCVGQPVASIALSGTVPGTTYSWTRTAGVIGLAPTSGTGNIPTFNAVNNGTTPVSSTFTVTPTYTRNGVTCTGTTMTFTITVSPQTSGAAVTNQTYCVGATVPAIEFTGPVQGTIFSWTRSAADIGLAATSGTGNIPSFVTANNGNTNISSTFIVTPSYLLNGVSCTGIPFSFTITVNPTPNVTAVTSQTVCSGQTMPQVQFTGAVQGTVYNWSRTPESIGLGATSGVAKVPSFVASTNGAGPVTSSFNVTTNYTFNGVTCGGGSTSFTMTVNPTPAVNPVDNQTVCAGQTISSIVFDGYLPGTIFSWTRTSGNIGLSANSGTGNIPSFTALNSGSAPVSSTFTVTPTFNNNGVTCAGTAMTFTVTVNPVPSMDGVDDQTYCSLEIVPNTSFVSTVPGTDYSWTRTPGDIGLGATAGIGNVPAFAATNSGNNPLVSFFTVTPSFTNNGTVCTGSSIAYSIMVHPVPSVDPEVDQTVCPGQTVAAVNFTGPAPGTTFSWTRTATAIGLAPLSGSGDVPSFQGANVGNNPLSSIFTVVPTFTNNGVTCDGAAKSYVVTVNPTPDVNQVANVTFCPGQTVQSFAFAGSVPGTVFQWTRTSEQIGGVPTSGTGPVPAFAATNSGNLPISSTFTVTPSFTNNGVTCTGSPITFTVTVNPVPTIDPLPNKLYCANLMVPAQPFTGGTPGTEFLWTRTAAAIGLPLSGTGAMPAFTATNTTDFPLNSIVTATPVYTNNGVSCTGTSATFNISVLPPPRAQTKDITIYLDSKGEAEISIPDIDNGSKGGTITIDKSKFTCPEKGANLVILTVTDTCGLTDTSHAIVTVLDTIPPALACPADRVIELQPGACCVLGGWQIPQVTDNCPLPGPFATLSTANIPSNNFGAAGGTVYFDIQNLTGTAVSVSELGLSISNGTVANIYVKQGSYVGSTTNPAVWSLATTANATAGPFAGPTYGDGTITPASLNTPLLLQPGITGIAIHTPGAVQNFVNGNGGNQTFSDAVLTVSTGAASNGLFNGNLTPRVFRGYVKYATAVSVAGATQIAGPANDAELCRKEGPWTVVYEAVDASGNRSECAFTINVLENPNKVSNLTCNDMVQISLGENCDTKVGADDMLEGGPYGCYDDYAVSIYNTSGQVLTSSPYVGRDQIGGTWIVEVTDPVTGSKCWGKIIVEDKLKPEVVCRDLVVDCGESVPLQPAPAISGPQEQSLYDVNDPIGSAGSPVPDVRTYAFDYSHLPEEAIVTDVDVRLKLSGHTRLQDLNVEVVGPDGKSVYVFSLNACAGQEWPIDVIFDDQGTGGWSQCAELNAGGARIQPLVPPGASGPAFFRFNGGAARGVWRVNISDNYSGNDGVVEVVGIIVSADAPASPAKDNCTPTDLMNQVHGKSFPAGKAGLVYNDVTENFACGQDPILSQRITRYWTARDEQGNTGQCVQHIDVVRPELEELVLPLHYDDLPGAGHAPSLNCKDPYPAPSVTGYPGGIGCNSLQVLYVDKVLPVCQASYTIIRDWKVFDLCKGESREFKQIIKVLDKTGPTIVCPQPSQVKVGLTKKGQGGCMAGVSLPDIKILDDCSSSSAIETYAWTTLPDGSVVIVDKKNAQGLYAFELPVQPPPHQYNFVYAAIDDCGNKTECSVDVAVRDIVSPVAVCEEFHVVSLTDSVTLIHASSFDDGSTDDCSDVEFSVRRGMLNAGGEFTQHPCSLPGDFQYAEKARIYCCDVNSTSDLYIELRVRDGYGNENFCHSKVSVVDKVKPVIWCPENITVQCGADYNPSDIDSLVVCVKPDVEIKGNNARIYPVTLDLFGVPADAKITDLDIKLDIQHEAVNQLAITLYSPLGKKARVLSPNSCTGQPVQHPADIKVTFNDQAYDLAVFSANGQKVPAPFTCTASLPSIGSFNEGIMKSEGDELKVFNGQTLNSITNKDECFTVSAKDINPATNRLSGVSVQQFIASLGLAPGTQLLMQYTQMTGSPILGLSAGTVYLFEVVNGSTMEFLTITGSDMASVAAGSTHSFCISSTWLLVVEDTAPLAGGLIHEVCLNIGYVMPTGLRPVVTDNTEECGLTVTHQDLSAPAECSDNTFINRRWSVSDAFGNSTSCVQRVSFNDATPLTVQFPCDVTVICADPAAAGEVRHNADCEIPGVEFTDKKLATTDDCYTILRTWVVKDWCKYEADGKVDYLSASINDASEEITFTASINPLLTARKIEVGDRVTLRYQSGGTTEIPGLVEGDVYSMTRVSGTTFRVEFNTTKQQSVNITGAGAGPQAFRYANSELGLPRSCETLKEWYPFVDWYTACCDPASSRRQWEDDGDGFFKFVQEIKVSDNVDPVFLDCSDIEECSFEPNCGPTFVSLKGEATDNCAKAADLSYDWSIDAFNDGTTDLTGTGSDASGSYPLGTHRITFKVTDQCGNWSTCTKLFTIKDCKKPTPICINGLSVDLMPSTGMAVVTAKTLESGSSHDNCTAYGDLTILVERLNQVDLGQNAPDGDAGASITVNCDDHHGNLGIVQVVVWVGDEAGNWDYCITNLEVQDNMGACGSGNAAALTAYTANEDGEAVEKVHVELTGASTQSQVTGTGGTANFTGLLTNQNVTVTPVKDMNPLNGVSTYDLLLMQKHLLGIKPLNSTYKLIAADVNNNANISISDIIELRKMILTPGLNFKDNTSWRFVDASYVFPNPVKPFGFPETKSFAALGMTNAANFVAVKVGDVSGDHTPNSLLGSDTRNSVGALTFVVGEQALVAGQQYTVAVRAEKFRGVQGYQYTMEFNTEAVEFVGVDAVWADLSESNFGSAKAGEGILTTSWNGSEPVTLTDGEVLYAVTFRAKANGKLSQALTVNSRVTKAEAYDASEELLDVQFRFDGGVVTGGEFALYQNEPNPFLDVTLIGFQLPAATKATLKVYDVTGKVLKVITGEYAKGYHTIALNSGDIQGNGMLYYQLDTDTDSATRRMILAE